MTNVLITQRLGNRELHQHWLCTRHGKQQADAYRARWPLPGEPTAYTDGVDGRIEITVLLKPLQWICLRCEREAKGAA